MVLPTNTVHVVAPPETDLEATHLVFERFGEVAAVDVLSDDPSRVSVAFFDVRSAARAVEALGSSYCAPGPQCGSRSVFLAADAQFQLADFSGISDCRYDDSKESYVIEFFDIRDAAKYETEVASKKAASAPWEDGVLPPPGLELPPGLAEQEPRAKKHGSHKPDSDAALPAPPPGLVAPPGLEAAAAKPPAQKQIASDECVPPCSEEPVCQVSVSGLPNKLLSSTMMEAVLQQAGLDACVTNITLRSGKPVGEAIISFSSRMAAEHCVTHFQGCQWDQSGKGVTTRILTPEQDKTRGRRAPAGLSAKAAAWEPWNSNAASPGFEHMGLDMSAILAAGMPGFLSMHQAGSILAEERPASSLTSTALSAKAPEFVPGGQAMPLSDTSTEVGESEAEDEKGVAPQMLLATPQKSRPARPGSKEGVGTASKS